MPEDNSKAIIAELRKPVPQYQDRIDNPANYPVIERDTGEKSTHLMAAEIDEDGVSHAFPMIVMMPNKELKEFTNPWEAMAYNKSIGNTTSFETIEEAVEYAEGAYKTPEFLKYFETQ